MNKIKKNISLILFSIIIYFISISPIFATTGYITISSNNKVVIGKTFSVSIKVSSSVNLGSWQFTPSYDKKKLQLIKGQSPVLEDYTALSSNKKSITYNYTFKAIATGDTTITVKSYSIANYDEKELTTKVYPKSITIITQAQLEATYSKNNNLKSLSIDGLKLSPSFNKSVTEYKVSAGANTTKIKIKASAEDSKSKVSGTGSFNVTEGENKFEIKVTAQNDTVKIYTVIVNVVDPNPIEVIIDEEKYVIVKRESNLDSIDDFEKKNIKINNQTIPALYNKLNDYTLVGLKNTEGEIILFIYDEKDNSYKKYEELELTKMKIQPLSIPDDFNSNYEKVNIKILDMDFEALKINEDGMYIIHARDLKTSEENYYQYDKKTNTIVRYINNKTIKENTTTDNSKDKLLITILGTESIIVTFILICILLSKLRKNKKRRQLINEQKQNNKTINKKDNIKKERSVKNEKINKKEKDS